MILARVMDHRKGVASEPSAIEPLDQALSRVHELAAVYWDRDEVSLDEHTGAIITVGLWDPSEVHDGAHGCVVVIFASPHLRQVVFTGDLRWVNDDERAPAGDFYRDLRRRRILGDL